MGTKDVSFLLEFTENLFHKLNLITNIIDITKALPNDLDLGLRNSIIGANPKLNKKIDFLDPAFIEKHIIYFSIDKYKCHYIFIPLPTEDRHTIFAAGPYLTEHASIVQTNELCKKLGIPANLYSFMHQYFSSLPCMADTAIIENYIDTIGEYFYGVGNYEIAYITQQPDYDTTYLTDTDPAENEDMVKRIEYRYSLERNIVNAISRGDFNGAMRSSADPAVRNIDNRTQSTLRGKKNNLLAFNTICRRGAEIGGVHPLFLDETSRNMAVKIENMVTASQDTLIHKEILKTYCALVRQKSTSNYSPTLQRAMIYVIQNLYDHTLTLQSTADQLNINKSYLATLFKKETGDTFTKYINTKRLERAIFLLNTTSHSIQSIANDCGIEDVTYFTRLFKKEKSMTPTEYRAMLNEK